MTYRMVALILIVFALTACATASQQSPTVGTETTGKRPPETGGY
jgi:hypothetical protein